jgi:hypothetical protein
MVSSVGVAGAGTTSDETSSNPGLITMERDGRDLFFVAPEEVERGTNLKVKNKTNPNTVGPHTFSLVKKSALPKTRQQIRDCGRNFEGICGAITEWHEVDIDTGDVGRNPVDVGQRGWNREGSRSRVGDSVVTERRNQAFDGRVSAQAGTKLHFICAIHPEMQGAVKVVEDLGS